MNFKTAEFTVDASNTGSNAVGGGRIVLDCAGLNVATVQAEQEGASAWSTAVLTVYRTNRKDDGSFFALQSATTLTAEGITDGLDVSAFRYLVVAVTTAQASLSLRITLYAQE